MILLLKKPNYIPFIWKDHHWIEGGDSLSTRTKLHHPKEYCACLSYNHFFAFFWGMVCKECIDKYSTWWLRSKMIQIWFGLILRFRLVWKAFSFCLKNKRNKKLFWGLLGSSHVQTSLENIFFLFENQKEQTKCFWGLLGSSHVQTSLENIFFLFSNNKKTVLGGYLDLAMFRKHFLFVWKTTETKNNVLGGYLDLQTSLDFFFRFCVWFQPM